MTRKSSKTQSRKMADADVARLDDAFEIGNIYARKELEGMGLSFDNDKLSRVESYRYDAVTWGALEDAYSACNGDDEAGALSNHVDSLVEAILCATGIDVIADDLSSIR